MDAYDRKVLASFYLPDGRLKEIPAQRRKLEVVLRYVVKTFEPGVRYTEKQVNQKLARFPRGHGHPAAGIGGYGLMKREGGGGDYWVEGTP